MHYTIDCNLPVGLTAPGLRATDGAALPVNRGTTHGTRAGTAARGRSRSARTGPAAAAATARTRARM